MIGAEMKVIKISSNVSVPTCGCTGASGHHHGTPIYHCRWGSLTKQVVRYICFGCEENNSSITIIITLGIITPAAASAAERQDALPARWNWTAICLLSCFSSSQHGPPPLAALMPLKKALYRLSVPSKQIANFQSHGCEFINHPKAGFSPKHILHKNTKPFMLFQGI